MSFADELKKKIKEMAANVKIAVKQEAARRETTGQNESSTSVRKSGKQTVRDANESVKGSTEKAKTTYYDYSKNQSKWYKGETPTHAETLARMYQVSEKDPSQRDELWSLYEQEASNPSSPLHETYGKATSPYVTALGVTDSDINDDFFTANAGLFQAGVHTSTGSLSSAKKNGAEALLAYNLNGLYEDYQATKKLQAEEDDIVKEAAYWIQNGLSDDEIKQKLAIGETGSKYTGITAAIERSRSGEYTPTTTPIWAATSYGVDGMLWALRNPEESSGDYLADAVQKELGRGKRAPETSAADIARRTPGNEAWAPYATGSTLTDEGILFGETQFDRQWLEDHRSEVAASGDKKKQAAYTKIADAVEFTEEAQKEAALLKERVYVSIENGLSPDEIFTDDLLESDDYKALKKMYDGQNKLSLVDTSAPVDFDLYALRNEAERKYQEQVGTVPEEDFRSTLTQNLGADDVSLESYDALDQEQSEKVSLTRKVMEWTATPSESSALKLLSPAYARVKASALTCIDTGMSGSAGAYNSAITAANDYATAHYLPALSTLASEKAKLAALEQDMQPVQDYIKRWFPDEDAESVFAKLDAGEAVTPTGEGAELWLDDPNGSVMLFSYKQEYQQTLDEYQKTKARVDNEQQIVNNIAGMYADASELKIGESEDQSVLPMLDYIGQFAEYSPRQDYAAFGDWQYAVELGGTSWDEASKQLERREKNNQTDMESIDAAIQFAEEHGVDSSYLDGLRAAREVVETDNRSIEYARLQDNEGFADAVAAFDETEAASRSAYFNDFLGEDSVLSAWGNSLKNLPRHLSVGHAQLIRDAVIDYDILREKKLADENYMPNNTDQQKVYLMTDNERNTYKYLYETQGTDAATEYYDFLDENYLGNRKTEYRQMVADEMTRNSPIMSNALSMLASPLKALGAVEVVRAALTGDEIDPSSEWFTVSHTVNQVRETSQEQIAEHFGSDTLAGKVASFCYQVVTSMGDSLAAAPTGGAITMGIESFADTALDATMRGADKWDTILLAGITGVAEVATEYLPMENIEKAFEAGGMDGLKGLAKSALSGVTEAPGEMLSEIIGGVADNTIMGELSSYSESVAAYMANGDTQQEAEKKATLDFWKNVGMAGLAGWAAGSGSNVISHMAGSAFRSKEQSTGMQQTSAETQTMEPAAAPVVEATPTVEQSEANEAADRKSRIINALATSQQNGVSLADRTATVNGVMEAAGMESDLALAAAKEVAKDIPSVQKLQSAIQKATDPLTVMKAAAYKKLVPSSAFDTMTDVEVVNAVESNTQLTAQLTNTVMNSAIASETVQVLSEMDSGSVKSALNQVSTAKKKLDSARKRLNAQSSSLETARAALQTANERLRQNPADSKLANATVQAAKEWQRQKGLMEQAQTEVTSAKQDYTDAKSNLTEMSNQLSNAARKEAMQRVLDRVASESEANVQNAESGVSQEQAVPATVQDAQPQKTFSNAQEIYQEASEVQNGLNQMLGEIHDELGLQTPYDAVDSKSVESMENKAARKQAEGLDYSLLDMKDHARSRLILDSFDQVDSVLKALDARGVPYEVEAVGPTDYGYRGLHVTWRTENGLGVEVQLTTPEAWKTKLASDQIYDKWRNADLASLTDEQTSEAVADQDRSLDMWNQLDLPDLSMYARASASDTAVESQNSLKGRERATLPQRPSENSSMVPTVPSENVRSSRPDSVTEYRNFSMRTPPSTASSIQPQGGSVKQGTSQFAVKTGQNTNVLTAETKQKLLDSPYYQKTSEKKNMERAVSKIEREGYEARRDKLLYGITNILSPEGQVEAYALSQIAKANGDADGQAAIAFKVKDSGTILAQALAMRAVYAEMSPEANVGYVQRLVDQINDKYESKNKDTRVELPSWVEQALLDAGDNQEAVSDVLDRAYREIARQMPYSLTDTLKTWRYLSMLGNPLTHIKNMFANMMFMPYVAVKNRTAAGMEAGVAAVQKMMGKETIERSKTFGPLKQEYKQFAKEMTQQYKDVLKGDEKANKNNGMSKIDEYRQKAPKWIDAASKVNGDFLAGEDLLAKNHYFKYALASYLQANKADLNNLNEGLLARATQYAVNEAYKNTFNNVNEFGKILSNLSSKGMESRNPAAKGAAILLEGTVPFKNTPANIVSRGVEYSPIGLMNAIFLNAIKLKNGTDYHGNTFTTQNYIDGIASGLTGTAAMALGALLASAGILELGNDEDDEVRGVNKNSINLFGYNVGIDWAGVASMPLLMGAELWDKWTKKGEEPLTLADYLNAFKSIADPIMDLSMVQGITGLLETASYSDNALGEAMTKMATSYLGQFVPTVLGAITRTFFDDTRRTTYTDKNSGTSSAVQYLLQSMRNKIPGLSQQGMPYLDAWGNEQKTASVLERFLTNFLIPGYPKKVVTEDEVTNNLLEMFDEYGDSAYLPTRAKKKFTVNGKDRNLTQDEYIQYAKERGSTAHGLLGDLMANEHFQQVAPEYQLEAITNVWKYSSQTAAKHIDSDYNAASWITTTNDPLTSVLEKMDESIATDEKEKFKSSFFDAYESGDLTSMQMCVAGLHEYGYNDKDLRKAVKTKYQQEYKEMSESGDMDGMRMLRDMMLDADIGFTVTDFAGWLK